MLPISQQYETNYTYFGARYYDSDLSSWLSVDPLAAARPNLSPYNYCQNNPVVRVDPTGMLDDIVVTTKKGKELFRLDDGKTEITTMTASELYGKGIQWFEPTADNYMPLKSISKDIKENSSIKHFTWEQIANFALNLRNPLAFLSGGSGDLKSHPLMGDGYLLSEVEGMPYWTDALGQIPYAVGTYMLCSKVFTPFVQTKEFVANASVIKGGYLFSTGSIHDLFKPIDSSKSYDNMMILRGLKWANMKIRNNSITDHPANELAYPINNN